VLDYLAMFSIPPILAFSLPDPSLVLGWVVFGAIGMIAVGYGKMKGEWPPAAMGFGLMFYPYLIPSGELFWIVGVALSVLFFLPKRVLGF
jgi:hypothetical protein